MDLTKVFKNLKVIELAGILAGPLCGKFFAELGATVIKVENKLANGDATRKWKNKNENYAENISSYFAAANYKKQSIFLNLKEKQDYETFINEVKSADILIANFDDEKAKKLKVDFETIKKICPKIIYANLVGYLNDKTRPAFDAVLQAESGYINLNGKPNQQGLKIPFAFIDVFANHQLREAILIALLKRNQLQKAQYIEVSLLQSAIASLINQASNYLSNNVLPQKMGNLHPNIAPYGETFLTKNGEQIILAIGTDLQFQKLLKVLKLDAFLEDEKFKTNPARIKNRVELAEILKAEFLKLNSAIILKNCKNQKIPIGLVSNFEQVFKNQEAQQMILKEKIEGRDFESVKTVAFKIE